MWLEILALAKSAIELARDIAGRRKDTNDVLTDWFESIL